MLLVVVSKCSLVHITISILLSLGMVAIKLVMVGQGEVSENGYGGFHGLAPLKTTSWLAHETGYETGYETSRIPHHNQL